MPISRYEIRNEYSLADPELYRAADKDDPEALLEGVAMAGLVGVLRQLGDLAEFAAEIFHNLHEEVLATAARGHGLMDRVQQLETEIPSIERAFLSKTDNSSYFYHPAVDWHPNLRIDQNLVTQGDLPRFVMNSYEECRAPPRLFLLDKFDVAGAGSCLKRYTDPSFFKVETSGMTNADVKREKKIRKAKKKGPRWRNGETTEVLPTSRTKLHQLLMEEERIENGVRNPTRRVELKRKLNGFPFNLKIGKSYMEKLLDYPSPDNKMVHEVTVNSSMSTTFDHNESGLEIVEVRPVCPDSENVGSKRSPPSSPDREEIMMNSSVYESSEVAIDDKNICNLYPSTATVGGISSTLDNVTREKVIEMNGESNREGSLIGYQSDDIVSEVDNYVDATSTIESDTDADSTSRMQSDFISSNIKLEPLISDANEENLQMGSFDSQSIGDSTISDEGNNSSRKAMSSLFSDSPSTSAENPQLERISTKVSKPVVFDDTCSNTDAITNHKSDYEQVISNLCSSESIPALVNSDSGLMGKDVLEGPQSDETGFTLHDEEKKLNLVMDPPCSSCVYDSDLQSGDELNGESIPSISTVSHIHYHSTNSSDKVTSDLPHGNEFVENIAFRFNSDHTQNENGTPNEMNSSKTLVPGKLDDENLSNDFPSDYPHIVENGDNVECTVSKEENLMNGLDNEDSGVPTDSPNQFPCFMETFLKKKLEETPESVNTHSIDAEDSHSNSSIENQISSENLVLSHLANSSDWPEAGIDAHGGDVIPDEETPKPCEVLGLAGTGLPRQASPDDSEAPCSSSFIPGELKEVTEMDETSNGQEVTEVSVSVDLNLPDKVHILLNEPDSGEDNSYTADMASAVPELSDNLIIDDIPSPIGLSKSVEENIDFFEDSGIDELENGKNSLSGSHEESRLAEKVDQIKAATSFSETVNTIDSDNPESEVSGAAPYTHLDSEDDQVLQLVHPEIIHPPVEKSLLYKEHDSEESIVQEEIGSLTSQLDHEVLHSCEITSEVSPINHQETIDPNDLKGDNYSELPRLSTNDIYVPKDPFDSILPPSNPSLETTQIDPGDVPPLPPLPPVQWMMTKLQHASSFTERETVKHEELFPRLISLPGGPTEDARSSSPSSFEEMKQSPSQTDDEPALKEEKVESSRMEVNAVHETVDLPPKNDNKLKQIVVPISESEFTSSTEEDGNANGSQIGKSPRPRHPLIDEFVALDKSKLRKVTERVIPEVPKVEERESLLEQIRTKSFNLRPALTSRPSIRGPNTNLKVAAIVERANAIRQALAGSDEDDDDSWSDS